MARARLGSQDTPKEDLVTNIEGNKKKRIEFCLVGLGRAGHFHLSSMALCVEHCRLRWVVDVDEAKCKEIASKHGCKWSTSIDEALNDPDIDAVIVASVTDTHFQYCKAALQKKKSVFTEKPISHDPKEVKEILDLAKSTAVPFIVGYQRRCDVNFRQLKRQLQSGKIGMPRVIKCCSRDNPLPPMHYLKTSGGIFHDMLSHDFDMLHFLTGEIPESVYSIGHCYNKEIEAMDGDCDTCVVALKFKSGIVATVDTSRVAAYGYDQRVEVFGENGMLTCHNQKESTVECATDGGYNHPVAQWSFPQRYKHTYTIELAEFIALIQHNEVEPVELIDRHLELEKVATGAELSYKLKRKVMLSEVDQLRNQHLNHQHKKART